MNLHEYQSKNLLKNYGCPVTDGEVVKSVAEVAAVIKKLGLPIVAKVQIHAGGRGKAGGVKIFSDIKEVEAYVEKLLGTNLVTYQTDEHGQPVHEILLAKPCDIERELYLGAVVDRAQQRVVFMASTEGGVEIEKIAEETPDKILTMPIDPLLGVMPYQARELAFALDLNPKNQKQFVSLMLALGKMFVENDLSLLEINPLVITKEGELICLDAKITLDDNAMYRHPKLDALRDVSQENDRENRAREWELNYVALDGNIGCMVNGAGLAMATMDIIKLYGGQPANFLDVGGGATKERVTEAFKIILSDSSVKGVLVNIFGGIVRCDLIADGIISAVKEVGVKVPVVARLAGTNAELGAKKLIDSGLNIIPASDLADAAEKIVKAVGAK
ncbi:MAG: ADP-forming succinate--CoA ligase subunit beta [Gammaproteobacteria bacterium]|nr:ADP-forming succinate--CoA ligase subunit beta [Gammaproteobacteria bacterium]